MEREDTTLAGQQEGAPAAADCLSICTPVAQHQSPRSISRLCSAFLCRGRHQGARRRAHPRCCQPKPTDPPTLAQIWAGQSHFHSSRSSLKGKQCSMIDWPARIRKPPSIGPPMDNELAAPRPLKVGRLRVWKSKALLPPAPPSRVDTFGGSERANVARLQGWPMLIQVSGRAKSEI